MGEAVGWQMLFDFFMCRQEHKILNTNLGLHEAIQKN